ncbi:UDP-glucose 4-epimerase [Azospirillum brasilense]|uniref:UDP-glucose 4-epimerase n=1 Tax=Azospirillum brasilense TaxID=192 RepID=A0A560BWS6_AZOBR|nr:SDR family oxidoreductase [Azospirillum brasilense]MBK3732708.1 SDR family NAD(P)-dependent oxidoreductase [Azospirillum brasilense]TWA77063.1 UDP-glucose 4-epimerase [Azospirillum brasilense]
MSRFDVVTGGAGFIGSHLVDALVAQGRSVLAIDNLAVGRLSNLAAHEGNPAFRFVQADVADRAEMARLLAGAERVFHLAALADIVPSVQNPERYFDANVNGCFSIAEAARANNVTRLLYAASSSCYGIPDVYPTPESAPPNPRYPYALTKYMGEQQLLHWAQVYGLPVTSLRLFNVYGPRARTSGTYGAVFGVFLAQMLSGKPLTVVGDGTQTRDFTFVTDVVSAFLAAAEKGHTGAVYNVGSGTSVSVNRLVELLGNGRVEHLPKRPGEPDCTFADTSRIRAELGWSPQVSIEDGVARLLDNLDYWRDAPVWDKDSIAEATRDWFRFIRN